MEKNEKRPFQLVLFGAGGDLVKRLVGPALFDLYLDGELSEHFALIGVDRRQQADEEFRQHLREGAAAFSRHGKVTDEVWNDFARRVSYRGAEFSDAAAFASLRDSLDATEKTFPNRAGSERVFYLAVPPTVFGLVAEQLGAAGLAADRERARLVVEKPFGRDLESALALTTDLAKSFREDQIYRIDHYLGKETVENILALRFANALFEPVWNRRYIDHVQITVSETVGVEHRGGYYDRFGALRDMIQNHLFQILCMIAMEPPVSMAADEVRDRKVEVLRAVRPLDYSTVHEFAVRGQYTEGWIQGQKLPGYREEPDVDPRSSTETFAALELYIDNWRWQDVPFFLRTGKRLPRKQTEVVITMRPVPHRAFPSSATHHWHPNRIVLQIQPDEGVVIQFQVKQPGTSMRLTSRNLRFSYAEAFDTPAPAGYETLLLDVLKGDQTLFVRMDQVEIGWKLVEPILEAWSEPLDPHSAGYATGTWGPEAAETLIARSRRSWVS